MLKAEQFTAEEQYDTTEAILRVRRAHNRVWSSVAVALLMSVFLLPALSFYYALSTIGEDDAKGPAPEADFATRREWGESELKHHFKRVDQWLRKADQITRDVGLVTGVAPIGGPNRFNSYFGESDASLNLQVIGKNGEGILGARGLFSNQLSKKSYPRRRFVFLTFVRTILTTSTGSSEAQHGLSMVGALDSSWRAGEVDSSDPPEFHPLREQLAVLRF